MSRLGQLVQRVAARHTTPSATNSLVAGGWATASAAHCAWSATAAAAPAAMPHVFSRPYNVNGNEVKTGSTIRWEGKTWLVLDTMVNMRGRAHTTYNIDLKDVASTSKISIKVRPADKIEVIEMQTVRMNYLYRAGNTLFFMDPVSFEQLELDISLAPAKSAYYLIENSSTALVRDDANNYVKIMVPEKVVCTVESTSAARTKVNDAGGKDAKLTNGMTVSVPNHVEVGQHILINTITEAFLSKADGPPEPEVEKTYN